ncbi:hypothetical protein Abp1_0022 [Acinetobacter phage Abp1]|uniref:HNH nuclease domain-containing protein n=1 Tax=Acinetobacter phage Abp1 TaxID=1235824 RepID=R4IPY3_9CAUD|nr:HNH endonuclease [Acinetobacter phage Abp1]YP_009949083.1 HNH endonuclease [Acinetobacter phage SWH-Ab-3]AFV50997.1 hypothetical protein Abp1_0022 [Acinetobacter phage Abp1]
MLTDCIDHGKTKSLSPEGYVMVLNPYKKPRISRLHRIVYCQSNNIHMQDIEGLVVRHKCDNPRCVNPEHLEIGTLADNNKDRAKRGRSAKVVPSKYKLTTEDISTIRSRYIKGKAGKYNPNGYAALAKEYNVDEKVIYNVVKHKGRYA